MTTCKVGKIAVIGAGTMGLAFADRWLQSGLANCQELILIEAAQGRREELATLFSGTVLAKPDQSLAECAVVLLAVKPQEANLAVRSCSHLLSAEALVISIMAGVSLSDLIRLLDGKHSSIIRCMPNLPLRVGSGVSVYIPASGVSDRQIIITEQLLKAGGQCMRVGNEELLNAATAVSGSGPGYLFYLFEHFVRAGQELGFSKVEATWLVQQTVLGAVEYWQSSECDLPLFCTQVASTGGTTAAALEILRQNNWGDSFIKAVRGAYEQACKLSPQVD